jgi:hypothetical protein
MFKHPFFLAYGLMVVSFTTMASYRGWTFGNPNQSRMSPRTVRNNPGGFGPIYSDSPKYSGGK